MNSNLKLRKALLNRWKRHKMWRVTQLEYCLKDADRRATSVQGSRSSSSKQSKESRRWSFQRMASPKMQSDKATSRSWSSKERTQERRSSVTLTLSQSLKSSSISRSSLVHLQAIWLRSSILERSHNRLLTCKSSRLLRFIHRRQTSSTSSRVTLQESTSISSKTRSRPICKHSVDHLTFKKELNCQTLKSIDQQVFHRIILLLSVSLALWSQKLNQRQSRQSRKSYSKWSCKKARTRASQVSPSQHRFSANSR